MKVSDTRVMIHFDDGMSTSILVNGYLQALMGTESGELSYLPVSGSEKFIKDAESKTFIRLGDELRRYKDIRKAEFFDEQEREVKE
jgi:hypothetical protein